MYRSKRHWCTNLQGYSSASRVVGGFGVSPTHPVAKVQLQGLVEMVDYFRRISRVLVRAAVLARQPCTSRQTRERGQGCDAGYRVRGTALECLAEQSC